MEILDAARYMEITVCTSLPYAEHFNMASTNNRVLCTVTAFAIIKARGFLLKKKRKILKNFTNTSSNVWREKREGKEVVTKMYIEMAGYHSMGRHDTKFVSKVFFLF